MIEEQFVSFDTARLLKEAGFDVPCEHFYTDDDYGEMERRRLTNPVNHNAYTDDYSCPTQSLVSRWLRDAHQIHVGIVCYDDEWFWDLWKTNGSVIGVYTIKYHGEKLFPSYEEAMEAGIQEAIKFIKQQDNERI